VIRAGFHVHSPSLIIFNEVFTASFSSALEGLLGRGVKDEAYLILESKYIRKDDIPSRFSTRWSRLLSKYSAKART